MANDLTKFAVATRGEAPDWQMAAGVIGQDWSEGAEKVHAVWRTADLDRPVTTLGGGEAPLRSQADQQITELTVHGWDRWRATGQRVRLDPELAERALTWSRRMLRPEFRGPETAIGAELPVADDAPVYGQLLAWFGRDPQWTAGAAARSGDGPRKGTSDTLVIDEIGSQVSR